MSEQPDEMREPDPELDFDVTDALATGPVDMTALLIRRFAWDTTTCDSVPDLLTALGLTHGSPEGMKLDHQESHRRIATVFPVESHLRAYSAVLGSVITEAILGGIEDDEDAPCEEHKLGLANQNAEVILSGSRAIIAQLVYAGVLAYGPAAGSFQVAVVDE